MQRANHRQRAAASPRAAGVPGSTHHVSASSAPHPRFILGLEGGAHRPFRVTGPLRWILRVRDLVDHGGGHNRAAISRPCLERSVPLAAVAELVHESHTLRTVRWPVSLSHVTLASTPMHSRITHPHPNAANASRPAPKPTAAAASVHASSQLTAPRDSLDIMSLLARSGARARRRRGKWTTHRDAPPRRALPGCA